MTMPVTRLQMTAIGVFALLLTIVPGREAMAQSVHCELSDVTDVDFGELDLSLEGPFRVTADLNIRCDRGEPNETVYVCLHLGSGSGGGNIAARRMYGPDSNGLLFNVFKYPNFRGGGSRWGSAYWSASGQDRPPLFRVNLDGSGDAEVTRNLFFEIWNPRQQLGRAPGNYMSDFIVLGHSRLEAGHEPRDDCNDRLLSATAIASPRFTVEAAIAEPTAALGFAKAFAPDRIGQGGISRLTFTIDSSANTFNLVGLNFTDNFPDGMVVAPGPDASTTCTGGTVSAAAGGTSVGYSDGTVLARTICTVAVNVQALQPGTLVNTSGALTARFLHGDLATAEATLTVDPPSAPGFAKAFSPTTVDPGGLSTLTFTIDNTANLVEIGSLAFDDTFPDGLVVADTPNVQNTCGGTFAPIAGDTTVSLSEGAVAASGTCTLTVEVQALRSGTLTNTADDLTSELPVTTPGADATLMVNAVPLSVSMAFEPSEIDQGSVSRLTYALGNSAAVEASEVSLFDMLPADVLVASEPNAETNCDGGTLTAAAGDDAITYTGGALAADGSCTIAVDVTSAVPGSYPNGTESVISSVGASAPAEATLTVNAVDPLVFTKAFSPATVDPGEISTLTFTIDNSADNAREVGSVAFADDFPDGLAVAGTPNALMTCTGGALEAMAGGSMIIYSGGRVAAGATCTVSVDVQALRPGMLESTSSEISSDLPVTTPGASATLIVNEAPLSVSMMFEPATIEQGGVSTLTYGLGNGATVGASEVFLSDTLPAEVRVAADPNASMTCTGGMLMAVVGGTSVEYSGGGVAAEHNLHDRRRCDLPCRRQPCEQHRDRDLVAGHQRCRRSDADGRCGGCAGLYQGVLAGDGRSRRGNGDSLPH